MNVEFRWNPEPADWSDALRAAVPLYRWAPWFALYLAALSGVLLLTSEISTGLIGLGAAACVAALPPIQARLSFRGNPLVNLPVVANADEDALRLTIAHTGHSRLAWSSLLGWQETPRGIVLRTGSIYSSSFYAVPHRAFALPADEHRFRELLIRRVGPVS